MATIEERAKAAVRVWYNCNYPCSSFNECIFGKGSNTAYDCEECGADEFNNGYFNGATEQRKIDIEKACEWLSNHSMVDTDLFRKAMEK